MKKGKLKLDLKLTGTPKPETTESHDESCLVNKMSEMAIPESLKLDLKSENLITLKELGVGNGGTVSKVQHTITKQIMARKVICSLPPRLSKLRLKLASENKFYVNLIFFIIAILLTLFLFMVRFNMTAISQCVWNL
jgi:hypothetical protein